MKYFYELYFLGDEPPARKDTTTRFEEVEKWYINYEFNNGNFFKRYCIHVSRMDNDSGVIDSINDKDDLEAWRTRLEREFAWKPEKESIAEVGIMSEKSPLPSHEPHQQVEDDGFTTCYPNYTKTVFEEPVTVKHDEVLMLDKKQKPVIIKIINESEADLVNKWEESIMENKPSNIDPPHYQAYLEVKHISFTTELQWLETMCRIERFRNNPEHFIAALELQVRKYLDRRGKKDDDLQELQKGLWYYKFMVAYIKNGNEPIYVRDVDSILSRK